MQALLYLLLIASTCASSTSLRRYAEALNCTSSPASIVADLQELVRGSGVCQEAMGGAGEIRYGVDGSWLLPITVDASRWPMYEGWVHVETLNPFASASAPDMSTLGAFKAYKARLASRNCFMRAIPTPFYEYGLQPSEINQIPENRGFPLSRPSGPIHPRTYMTLFLNGMLAPLDPPPSTWQQLIAVVRDMRSRGLAQDALCLEHCKLGHLLMAIVATIAQVGGSQAGAWFEPASMEPLTGAVPAALRVLRDLVAISRVSSTSCALLTVRFSKGQCAMTLDFDLAAFALNTSAVASVVRMAPQPCSEVVLERITGRVVRAPVPNCAPFSTYISGAELAMDPSSFAPALFARCYAFNQDLLAYSLNVVRMRAAQRQTVQQENYTHWAAHGYPPLLGPMFRSMWKNNSASPNIASHLHLGEVEMYSWSIWEDAAHSSMTQPPEQDGAIAREVQARLKAVLAISGAKGADIYRRACGWVQTAPSPSPAGFAQGLDQGPTKQHRSNVLIAALASAGAVGLVVAAGALLAVVRRSRHLSWLGAVLPPAPGPLTTFVCTDIQGSTSLWEQLPQHVMVDAMRVHDTAARRLLLKHRGFEVATEGDAFILAFHRPSHALEFLAALQCALSTAEWDPGLLGHPDAREVHGSGGLRGLRVRAAAGAGMSGGLGAHGGWGRAGSHPRALEQSKELADVKRLSGAPSGGQVVCTDETMALCHKASGVDSMYLGEYASVADPGHPLTLYSVCAASMAPHRHLFYRDLPMRGLVQTGLGAPHAPGPGRRGLVKVVVQDAHILRRDAGPVFAAAMQQVARALRAAATGLGGFVFKVDEGEGLLLAAFPTAAGALDAAHVLCKALKRVDWDPELMVHPLLEDIVCYAPAAGSGGGVRVAALRHLDVLCRGPRYKIYVGEGPVVREAAPHSRWSVTYRGEGVNSIRDKPDEICPIGAVSCALAVRAAHLARRTPHVATPAPSLPKRRLPARTPSVPCRPTANCDRMYRRTNSQPGVQQ